LFEFLFFLSRADFYPPFFFWSLLARGETSAPSESSKAEKSSGAADTPQNPADSPESESVDREHSSFRHLLRHLLSGPINYIEPVISS
jgi:hypothetical protein